MKNNSNKKNPKKAILVLGMHRSGTSAITGAINILGVNLGQTFLPPNEDNEKGFWEHAGINDIHERLLAALDSSWDDIYSLPERWWEKKSVEPFRLEIINIIKRDFSNSSLWGIKDPRLCRLLPLWINIFHKLDCDPCFIIINRHPYEVAESLAKRNSFLRKKSYILWLEHVIEVEKITRRFPRMFVNYDRLLNDWRTVLEQIAFAFSLKWPKDLSEESDAINRFLFPALRHHKKPLEDLKNQSRIYSLAVSVYEAIKEAGFAKNELKSVSKVSKAFEDLKELAKPFLQVGKAEIADRDTALEESQKYASSLKATLAKERKDAKTEIAARNAALEESRKYASSLKATLAKERKDAKTEIAARKTALKEARKHASSLKAALAKKHKDTKAEIAARNAALKEVHKHAFSLKTTLAKERKDAKAEIVARNVALEESRKYASSLEAEIAKTKQNRLIRNNKMAFFTIVSKNYLPYARTLLSSVKRHYPNSHLFICLADKVDGYFDPKDELFEVVEAEDLSIPEFKRFAFRYDITEFNTAVKPFMFKWLFKNLDCDAVIFLDPDIYILSPLTDLERLLSAGSMAVIAPHITSPITDDDTPNEITFLRTGVYNLGFIALTRHLHTTKFLDWWATNLINHCTVNLESGLFVDQKWIDLLPCLFDNVAVLRKPGYNVAYWNLMNRPVKKKNGRWVVNGEPLVFFHFSGVNPHKPELFSKHQSRFRLSNIDSIRELYLNYLRQLKKAGYKKTIKWPYFYGAFVNTEKISTLMRYIYREDLDLRVEPQFDPFKMDIDYFNHPVPEVEHSEHVLISRLMYRLWKERPDLQKAFDLNRASGREGYLKWYLHSAQSEVGLSETFVNPIRLKWEERCQLIQKKGKKQHRAEQTPPAFQADDRFDEYSYLEQNPDVAKAIRNGRIASGREHWERHGKEEVRMSQRMYHRPEANVDFGEAAYLNQKRSVTVGAVKDRNGFSLKKGVNLIGYPRAEMGMGKGIRQTAKSLLRANIKIGIYDFNIGVVARQGDNQVANLICSENPFSVNIFHINADQIKMALSYLGNDFIKNRYNICFWLWELSKFPDVFIQNLDRIDEVWVPSKFIQTAISEKTSKPVICMPYSIDSEFQKDFDREYFNLPQEAFLFLFTFDFNSYISRKNPSGCIKAFKQAFPKKNKKVGLVIKSINGHRYLSEFQRLLDKVKNDPRITLMGRTMPPYEIKGLMQVSDCFVSLHRSEGFGLGLAESMLLGKPVIATNYSGNTDFMRQDNSCLVNYELIKVRENEYPFGKGQVWAKPDIDHAVLHMQRLVDDAKYRKKIASAGQRYIQTHLNTKVIGQRYKLRLKELGLV